MAVPQTRVEIAFTSGFSTPSASRAWVDVSDYVEGDAPIGISYGRADELATVDAGRVSLTLDNRDGRFSPGKATSPYFPNVKKGKPIRVSVRYGDGSWRVRGTWYVDEWPVEWPDGTNAANAVTITASSRRAQLGRAVPLQSSVKGTILSTNPKAYWPMDETEETTDLTGRQAFRDLVATSASSRDIEQALASFYSANKIIQAPVVQDGTPGPLDEGSLVRFPSQANDADIGSIERYVGSGNTVKINPNNSFTVEILARVVPTSERTFTTALQLMTVDRYQQVFIQIGNSGGAEYGFVAVEFFYRDSETGELLFTQPSSGPIGPDFLNPANFRVPQYLAATDGQIHHYAVTLTGGKTARIFMDGVFLDSLVLPGALQFKRPFNNVLVGTNSFQATAWLGHFAIHDRALTDAEIESRAEVMISAASPIDQRVAYLAERLGIPDNEIIIDPTIAARLGTQDQAGRQALEVLDEVAETTGGILHDDRDGNLRFRARNSRYNAVTELTLDSSEQEVQGDLSVQLDDRYLINTVTASRSDTDNTWTQSDIDSVNAYGVYASSIDLVTASDAEAEAAALDLVARFAEPRPRVGQVSVDVANLGASKRDALMLADIGSRLALVNLPTQAPTDPMYLFLEGYDETITCTSHTLTINTTPADQVSTWVLEDPSHGAIDAANRLAY